MGKILLAILAAAIVITGICVAAAISAGQVDSWLNRAKDAGNPGQAADFLKEYKAALYQRNYVTGKYLSVWRYPGDSMTVYVQTIDGLIGRAEALAEQDATATSYQMGLTNLEKDLGDMESAAFKVWQASGGWVVVVMAIALWIAFIITGACWLADRL